MSPQSKSDATIFSKVFTDYRQRFVLFANTYLRDKSLAEDVVMDSFMYYWEKRDSLATDSNIPAYILTVVKHKCLNHLRSKIIRVKVEKGLIDHNERILKTNIEMLEVFDPHELFSEEIQMLVNEAISALPNRTRDIFLRSRYQNQNYKEIADDLNITVKSVEFEVSKAMKVLRVQLKDYLPLLLVLLQYKWTN